MVGSYYYLATRSDWVYTSVYQNMFQRAKDRIMAANGFDEERAANMQKYIEDLEFQIHLLSGHSPTDETSK